MASLALKRLSQRGLSLSRSAPLTPQLFTQGCSGCRWLSNLSEEPPVKKTRVRRVKTDSSSVQAEDGTKKTRKRSSKKVVTSSEQQEGLADEPANIDTTKGKRARKSISVLAEKEGYFQRRQSNISLRHRVQADDYVPDASKLELPPLNDWRPHFPWSKEIAMRSSVRNPDTAAMLADAFLPEGSKDQIVIEANPGPGQLTRALLKLPRERLKRLIVVEHGPYFYEYVKPLEAIDDRITVIPYNGKDWSTYNRMKDMGLLDDVDVADWQQEHPQLKFVMQLSASVEGEQLLSQLFRAIPDRQWLFKYGRVPLNFVLSHRMWLRSTAPAESKHRCKVSVMGQAAAEMHEVVPAESLSPYNDHFHPRIESRKEEDEGSQTTLNERRTGTPHVAIRVTPWAEKVIKPRQLDFWDYCLRNLFIQKATPISKAINTLGPGGYNLLPKLEAKGVNISQTARELTVEDWEKVVQTFQDWPFRPEDLSIDAYADLGAAGPRF
ncbi:S-adenosyl-L-methionine-dependent methyltransferase [Panaeolus papilionaceus]|nr:S-adenosyl-L-methionine-dependent methyltransferase [Panaeolus papilionaceus]